MALPPLTPAEVTEFSQGFIQACKKAPGHALTGRFLCGISTPVLTKMKAKQLPNFGRLQHYGYQQILTWLQASD